MKFAEFKRSQPSIQVLLGIGLHDTVEQIESWREFQSFVIQLDDDDRERLFEAARQYDRVCSAGERALLLAILYVGGYAWVADDIANQSGRRFWRCLEDAYLSVEWRRAIAACIAQEA